MPFIYIPFWVEEEVAQKLRTGEYERVGGVIRRSDNKRIVVWLRQKGEIPEPEIISNTLFRIIAHSTDLETLTDEELIELGKFINGHKVLSSFNFYAGCKAPVASIIDKYERLYKTDKEKAKNYAHEKRQSLINIFGRTYIPNLKHQVELGMINMIYDEERNMVDFILRKED